MIDPTQSRSARVDVQALMASIMFLGHCTGWNLGRACSSVGVSGCMDALENKVEMLYIL